MSAPPIGWSRGHQLSIVAGRGYAIRARCSCGDFEGPDRTGADKRRRCEIDHQLHLQDIVRRYRREHGGGQ